MNKVLLIYGDGTQTLPMAQALDALGYEVHAIVSTKYSYGYGSKYIKKCFVFQEASKVDALYHYLLEILKNKDYSVVVPMHDESAECLSKYKDSLHDYTHFEMPDISTFMKGYDKRALMRLCQENHYPHPRTVFVEGCSLDGIDTGQLKYPLLIKPNITCGARGMTRCNNREELERLFPDVCRKYGPCCLQTIVKEGGRQVEVQLFVNDKGELVQSSVIKKFRWYPVNGGSSSCCVSEYNQKIVDICYSILKDLGWVGFADFDTIEDPETGELLILELNPRLPACIRAAFEAGVNWADIIVSEYLGIEHQVYNEKTGIFLRFLGFEILWFMKSPTRFRAKPNWFKFFGKSIFYQDMSSENIRPLVLGTIGNIKKLMSSDFRKAKAGVN